MFYTRHMEETLTRKHVALKLHCSERTIDRLIKAGLLKAIKIGSLVRITESALTNYMWGKETHE